MLGLHLVVVEAKGGEGGADSREDRHHLGRREPRQISAWSPNKGRLFCSNKAIVLSVQRIREIQGSKTVRLIHPEVPITDLRVLFLHTRVLTLALNTC